MSKSEKKIAKKTRKEQKRGEKRVRKLGKKPCVKCGHKLKSHFVRIRLWSIMGSSGPYCHAPIESRDAAGIMRQQPCACDLTPSEAYRNVELGAKGQPFDPDAALRELGTGAQR